MLVSNWGNYPVVEAEQRTFSTPERLRSLVGAHGELIPRGLGRCYGDSSLNSVIVSTGRYNRLLSFDASSGQLHCEAGVSLDDILRVFVPRGWFLPVTPGTRHVTVGGAIASDVHGKNHHVAGGVSSHLAFITLMLEDGSIVRCSREQGFSPLQRWEIVGWGTPFSSDWIGEEISMIETHPYEVADAVVELLCEQIATGRPSGKSKILESNFVLR